MYPGAKSKIMARDKLAPQTPRQLKFRDYQLLVSFAVMRLCFSLYRL